MDYSLEDMRECELLSIISIILLDIRNGWGSGVRERYDIAVTCAEILIKLYPKPENIAGYKELIVDDMLEKLQYDGRYGRNLDFYRGSGINTKAVKNYLLSMDCLIFYEEESTDDEEGG